MLKEILINNIRKYREEEGYNQKEFAKHINIPVSTLANYETGRREPSLEMIEKISKGLNKSPTSMTSKPIENINHIKVALPDLNQRNKMIGVKNTLEYFFFFLIKKYNLSEKEAVKIAARFNSTMAGLVDDIDCS